MYFYFSALCLEKKKIKPNDLFEYSISFEYFLFILYLFHQKSDKLVIYRAVKLKQVSIRKEHQRMHT